MIPDLRFKTVLDVGCGVNRPYRKFFTDRGALYFGIDKKSETPLDIFNKNREKLSHFDFIFCRDLFHSLTLEKKEDLFSFLLSKLRPGGSLLFNEYQRNTRLFDIIYKLLTTPWRIDQLLHRIFVGHFKSGGYHYANQSFYAYLMPPGTMMRIRSHQRSEDLEIERNWQARFVDRLIGGHRLWIKVTKV